MEETKSERLEYTLCLFYIGLIPIHLYLSVLNFFHGIDKGYGHSFPTRSYVLIGVYLLIVLAADVFMLCQRRFEPSKELRRYWGSAFIAAILVFVAYYLIGGMDEFLFLCFLYMPFLVLAPLLEFLGMPLYGDTTLLSIAVIGGFCLLNWAVCRFAVKEEKEDTP